MMTDRLRIAAAFALFAPIAIPAGATAQPTRTVVAPASSLSPAERKSVIEGAIAKIDANYVFPDKTPIIAKAFRRKLAAGGYDAIRDPQAFVVAVNADLAGAAHDRHLRLSYSPEVSPAGDQGPSPAEIEQMKAMMVRRNYEIPKVEVLDGNIGYLKIDLFLRAENAGPTLAAAMAFLQHSDALIIDLRDNHGGDPGMVALAASYLVPPQTELNSFRDRGQAENTQSWSLPYVPGGRWSVSKPVYVLTSKRTGSGAEEFAYDIQQLKRGKIVGEPTWGGANPGGVLPVDQHFSIFVPTGTAVNPISKTNWEGTGVKPDVAVDPATGLETAHHMALEKLSENATGEQREELQKLLDPAAASPTK